MWMVSCTCMEHMQRASGGAKHCTGVNSLTKGADFFFQFRCWGGGDTTQHLLACDVLSNDCCFLWCGSTLSLVAKLTKCIHQLETYASSLCLS